MDNTVYIYALTGLDQSPRYVGKSINPQLRLKQHIWKAQNNNRNHPRSKWIKDLIESGESPQVKILEATTADDSRDREIYWINKFNADGHALTNHDYAPGIKNKDLASKQVETRENIDTDEFPYMLVSGAVREWGLSNTYIINQCESNDIPGAIKAVSGSGKYIWIIPSDTPRPLLKKAGRQRKSAKKRGQLSLFCC